MNTEDNPQIRNYELDNCIAFMKTKDQFGGLSNMATGFPLEVNGIKIYTSESLYQICRFPFKPEIQYKIIQQTSPITAKMISRKFRNETRSDWTLIKVKIMKWVIRVKLFQNWDTFGNLLLSTGNKPIVELSYKDNFWGAKPIKSNQILTGMNVMGRLLMELRSESQNFSPNHINSISPLEIPDFLLYGKRIQKITQKHIEPHVDSVNQTIKKKDLQGEFFTNEK